MGELMSHRAGFTYGIFGNTPVDQIYRKNNPLEAPSLQAMIDRLSTMPLLYQPGTLGLQRVSGHPGLSRREAVGQDVSRVPAHASVRAARDGRHGFYVPAEKLSRVAAIYAYDKAKGASRPQRGTEHPSLPGLPSGGGGLYSDGGRLFPLRADASQRR